ncbi:MAG: TIM barrel protein [Planctomycetota bacterium]
MTRLVGTQMYPWTQYREREGRKLDDTLGEAFEEARSAGLDAWEHAAMNADEVETFARLALKHGLAMRSLYTGSHLHDSDRVVAELDRLAELAVACSANGITILTTNPDPVDWNTEQNKDDAQLRRQAYSLNQAVERCAASSVTLAYHVHAPEFRAGAREFHHMLLAVPDLAFCLDTHWLYTGCGFSNVALQDLVDLYADRVVSLHLRQSHGHVWSQTLGEGDLNHQPVFDRLRAVGFEGPVFFEAALQDATPMEHSVVEAHRRSADWLRASFP